MNRQLNSLLTGATLAALLLGSAAFAVADGGDDDGKKPHAQTNPATQVTDRSATLTAQVNDRGSATSFRFEYGLTTKYGQSTPAGTLNAANTTRTVTAAIKGLIPNTRYHYRVRASNHRGTKTGGNRSFTTTASAVTPAPGSQVSAPPSAAAPAPVLGRRVTVAPLRGTINVKRPGSSGFVQLAAGASVPVGTLVETRKGTVILGSSRGAGKTQFGVFTGGLFQVRQASKGSGTTDIVLRGGYIAGCPGSAASRSRASTQVHKRRRPKRRLWAHDKGGRFRTHGANSVATVRGTSWVTTDTCAGTRTTVKEGSVSVRDRRRRKTVLVRAGHSYLARSAR